MINISLDAWGWVLLFVTLSSAVGVRLSSLLPWGREAIRANVPFGFGLVLAPIVLGLLVVIYLWIGYGINEDGVKGATRLTLCYWLLSIYALLFLFLRRRFRIVSLSKKGLALDWVELLALGLLVIWCIALFINSVSLPLVQNDSLEYGIVGRILFDSNTLEHYPAVHSDQYKSGFYGPWTHPPLYVALIFLMNCIESSVGEPGLMRLISPWICLSTLYLVYCLGCSISRLVGLLSAVILISTPLYFLGADSSLIDVFPIAGFSLAMASVAGLNRSAYLYYPLIGVVVGLALWTHSEAILLVPISVFLVFLVSVFDRRSDRVMLVSLQRALICFISTLFVGGWWYLRNYTIFGVPVSDNPVIFAITELDWRGYFSTARGLNTWPAIVQYGWFKGWFSFEAFALGFWLMTFGVFLYLKHWSCTRDITISYIDSIDIRRHQSVIWVSFMAVLCYLMGVVASTLLGIDLLIKNERYLLFIMPAVAIFAGFALEKIIFFFADDQRNNQMQPFSTTVFKLCLMAIFLVAFLQWILVAGVYRWRSYQGISQTLPVYVTEKTQKLLNEAGFAELPPLNAPVGMGRKLDYWANLRAIKWLNTNTLPDALVLSLRPADMFYSKNTMLSYLDPKLEVFYRTSSSDQAFGMLRRLNVEYIQVSNYSLPVQYNSILKDILGSVEYTELLYSDQGNQISRLRNEPMKPRRFESSIDLTPGKTPWTQVTRTILGGRKGLSGLGVGAEPFLKAEVSRSQPPFGFFHRDTSKILYSGLGETALDGLISTFTPVDEGEYQLNIDLEGKGLIRIYMLEYDLSGQLLLNEKDGVGVYRFDEFVLDLQGEEFARKFSKRLRIYSATKSIRIAVEHFGSSDVFLKSVSLNKQSNYQ
ncbi:MAG: hypothetical protein R3E73_07500 [Porticoccaceae bacterium]